MCEGTDQLRIVSKWSKCYGRNFSLQFNPVNKLDSGKIFRANERTRRVFLNGSLASKWPTEQTALPVRAIGTVISIRTKSCHTTQQLQKCRFVKYHHLFYLALRSLLAVAAPNFDSRIHGPTCTCTWRPAPLFATALPGDCQYHCSYRHGTSFIFYKETSFFILLLLHTYYIHTSYIHTTTY